MKNYLKTLFVARQQQILKELDEYLHNLNAITRDMREAIGAYLKEDMQEFLRLFGEINKTENHLDTLRRDIESRIYERRLLPDTRDDILALLESLDKIPNRIQAVAREMLLQQIRIPELLHHSVNQLAHRGVEIVQVLTRVADAFLNRPHDVREGARQLSKQENEADSIEHEALKLIFEDARLELAEKMQLYHFVDRFGSICDMAEDVGDHVMICAIKRLL